MTIRRINGCFTWRMIDESHLLFPHLYRLHAAAADFKLEKRWSNTTQPFVRSQTLLLLVEIRFVHRQLHCSSALWINYARQIRLHLICIWLNAMCRVKSNHRTNDVVWMLTKECINSYDYAIDTLQKCLKNSFFIELIQLTALNRFKQCRLLIPRHIVFFSLHVV